MTQLWAFPERNCHLLFLVIANDGHDYLIAWFLVIYQVTKHFVKSIDRLPVDGDNQIAAGIHANVTGLARAGLQPGFVGRSAVHHGGDVHPGLARQVEFFNNVQTEIFLAGKPHIGIFVFAVVNQFRHDPRDDIAGYCEADAAVGWFAGGIGAVGADGAVDAHHFTVKVEQRAAGVAGLMAASVWIRSAAVK